jgi:hypothetical protein
MANIRYKTLEEFRAILEAENVPREAITTEEICIASLLLNNKELLQKRLAKAKRPILLKKEILSVKVTKESGLLGTLRIEFYLEAFGDKLITKVRRMGGTQLNLFEDPEVALQRFLSDHKMYFDKKNYTKFVHPDQKQLTVSGLFKTNAA